MIKLKSFEELKNELLTDEIQKDSKEYMKAVTEVERFAKEVADKKIAAEKEMPEIKKRIALLNVEYYKEKDEKKLKDIEDEKLQLRLKLDDLEGLTHTNIRNIINGKFMKDLSGYDEKARVEHILFQGAVRSQREEYLELQKEVQQKLNELSLIERMHEYDKVKGKEESLKRMDFIQDESWVGTGRLNLPNNNEHVYVHAGGQTYGGKKDNL